MATVTLDQAVPGSYVKVVEIEAGQGLKSRLISMGIYRGAIMKVLIVSQSHVVISLNSGFGRRIALSYGIARKVIVDTESASSGRS